MTSSLQAGHAGAHCMGEKRRTASAIIVSTCHSRHCMTPISNLHDFLDALPAAVRANLDAVSSTRSYPVDGRLLRVGVVPQEVFQIQEGRVKYSSWDHNGRETVLTYMSHGDWVGLSEVFTDLPAMWTVAAQSPLKVRVISRRDFSRLIDEHPALSRQLLRVFAFRFSLHRLFGLDHSALTLKERVIKMLYFLSFSHDKEAPGGQPIFMKLSQEELGKVVGASRPKLNQALKALEKDALLDVRFGGVTLRSRNGIEQAYGHLLNVTPSPR